MIVHFIGAGPGAPDLITVRGLNLIRRCPVCLYAGSLVPRAVIAEAPDGARIVDTAPLNLDEIIGEIETAHARGPRRCARAFRRSLALRRDRRADAPARCARHRLRRHAGGAGVRRGGGGTEVRVDLAGGEPDGGADAHLHPLLADAGGGRLENPGRQLRHPRRPPVGDQPRQGGARPAAALRRRLSGRRRLPGGLAGRGVDPRHAGATSARR